MLFGVGALCEDGDFAFSLRFYSGFGLEALRNDRIISDPD